MRFFRRSLIGLFLMAVTLGLLAWAGQIVGAAVQASLADKGPGAPARERVFSANVVKVTPGRLEPELTAFGEVRSRRTLEVRPPRGGTVAYLAPGFEDGAAVTAGQVLLRLDGADATAARDLAAADIASAEAELREAERAVGLAVGDLAAVEAQAALRAQAMARQQDLQDKGVGSAAAVETAALAASGADQSVLSSRSALAQAEARVDRARTALARQHITLAEAERALRETELVAEFAGTLSGVAVVAGGIVSANERLAELINTEDLEVSFRLSTSQFARLIHADGALITAPVQVSLDVSGAEIATTGRLSRVGAAVGEGQSGRLVYAGLDAARGFRPGDFVTVTVAEPAIEGVALLPATAVDAAGRVLALGEGDRLDEVTVEVLRQQGDGVIIHAGALSGREVVAARSPLLGAGIAIKPIRAGVAAEDLVELTKERRAELVAFVEANERMPAEAKARVLQQLSQAKVPAAVIARLEQRMGG